MPSNPAISRNRLCRNLLPDSLEYVQNRANLEANEHLAEHSDTDPALREVVATDERAAAGNDRGAQGSQRQVGEVAGGEEGSGTLQSKAGNSLPLSQTPGRGAVSVPQWKAGDRPITLPEVRKQLLSKLSVPMRVGRFRERPYGICKTQRRIIRMRASNDVAILSHPAEASTHHLGRGSVTHPRFRHQPARIAQHSPGNA